MIYMSDRGILFFISDRFSSNLHFINRYDIHVNMRLCVWRYDVRTRCATMVVVSAIN